ncbi:MAG: SurA N-terminal domain-containing protein [Betaproteobacteria bacterium AqS2]|uniref:SurA N-terminal domain-containing protein n=1 Tax=Candidatus Amphirhobacter heronislandensis TaxID=1732024 RepID=A0A930UHA9_9GAMM|nr:SurA N-terminal domain-containing protein [Betaproteobacteria bacterium AqS2]
MRSNRRRLSAFILLLASAAAARGQEADSFRLAASVNGDPILTHELDERIAYVQGNIERAEGRQVAYADLYPRVLEIMIEERLVLQRARDLGSQVNEIQVTQAVERLLQQRQMTLEQLLEANGVDEERLRAEVRKDLLIENAFIRDNRRELAVAPDEVNQRLRLRLENERLREYLIEHAILTADKRPHAEALSLLASEDFYDAALQESVSTNPVNLGWLHERQMPAAYLEQLERMQPGDVSPVMEFSNGLHVIHMLARRPVVQGQVRPGKVTAKMLRVPADVDDEDLVEAVSFLKLGLVGFEELAEEFDGEIVTFERLPENMPQEIRNNLTLRLGELAGPFVIGSTKVILRITAIDQMVIGSERYRDLALNEVFATNRATLRRKWIEHLRSISAIEIIRAEP